MARQLRHRWGQRRCALRLQAGNVLTRLLGDLFAGITGLSLAMPVATATAAVVGIPKAAGELTLEVLIVKPVWRGSSRAAIRPRDARAAQDDP